MEPPLFGETASSGPYYGRVRILCRDQHDKGSPKIAHVSRIVHFIRSERNLSSLSGGWLTFMNKVLCAGILFVGVTVAAEKPQWRLGSKSFPITMMPSWHDLLRILQPLFLCQRSKAFSTETENDNEDDHLCKASTHISNDTLTMKEPGPARQGLQYVGLKAAKNLVHYV